MSKYESKYDIINSSDFESNLDNMFDLLVYFRNIISASESYLKTQKEFGNKYEDDELYVNPEYSIEKLQSIMQKEISVTNELIRIIEDHLDLFHDWD